jgi:hypothetical protein
MSRGTQEKIDSDLFFLGLEEANRENESPAGEGDTDGETDGEMYGEMDDEMEGGREGDMERDIIADP